MRERGRCGGTISTAADGGARARFLVLLVFARASDNLIKCCPDAIAHWPRLSQAQRGTSLGGGRYTSNLESGESHRSTRLIDDRKGEAQASLATEGGDSRMPAKSKKRKTPLKAHDLKAKNDPKGGKGRKGRKGGKADFHDISFTHSIDKSSPVLLG